MKWNTQIFDMRKAATSIRELLAQRYLTTILKLYLCIQISQIRTADVRYKEYPDWKNIKDWRSTLRLYKRTEGDKVSPICMANQRSLSDNDSSLHAVSIPSFRFLHRISLSLRHIHRCYRKNCSFSSFRCSAIARISVIDSTD